MSIDLGAIIHEMITGLPPFYCEDQNEMFEEIKNKEFKM
jgi:serine/threonine protein kinase